MSELTAMDAVSGLFGGMQPFARDAACRWRLLFDDGPQPLLIPATDLTVQLRCVQSFRGAVKTWFAVGPLLLEHMLPVLPLCHLIEAPGIHQAPWLADAGIAGITNTAIQIGTPGPYQKATLLLMDAWGEFVALSKVALGHKADAMIRREASWLTRLARKESLQGAVPKLLHCAYTADGRRFLITDVGPAHTAGQRLEESHRRFLACMGRTWMVEKEYTDSRGHQRLSEALQRLGPRLSPELRSSLQQAASECHAILAHWHGPLTLAHGDFAPWNLRRGEHGLYAFDWEYAWHQASPAYDVLHFRLAPRALSRRSMDVSQMAAAVEEARRFLEEIYPEWVWEPPVVAAFALFYLLDVMLYYGMADGFIDLDHPLLRDYLRMVEARTAWMP